MEYIVVKCGGSVLDQLPDSFFENLVSLHQKGIYPVVVHGGGPKITQMLDRLGISSNFIQGMRVTTPEVLDVVEMVLCGNANKQIVRRLAQAGGMAIGLSGIDGNLLQAKPFGDLEQIGYVGEVVAVNHDLLQNLCGQEYLPVIAPLGVDEQGQRYNINADLAAASIAKALGAKLCFVSDIPGICISKQSEVSVLDEITDQQAKQLIADQVITGGMIPKIKAALDCLHTVPEVAIVNGFEESCLLKFSAGLPIGTKVVAQGGVVYG